MNKKPIILIGAGGHAESCIDLINEQNKFKIQEVIELKKELHKVLLNKFKVKFDDTHLKTLSKKYKYALIGIGQIHNYEIRKKLCKTKILKIYLTNCMFKAFYYFKILFYRRGNSSNAWSYYQREC